jgi:hypothetical protein
MMKYAHLLFFITFSFFKVANAQPNLQAKILTTGLLTPNANNAVAAYKDCIYSFGGINNTLSYFDINSKCSSYCLTSNLSNTLPNLPDSLPVIAASASTIKDKIYILGGYHVYPNGIEASFNSLRIFDPNTQLFLANGAPSLVPIDDQVQVVWRDSLLISVTGWSNTTNVTNVQIYNPANNTWLAGTPVPNTNAYKAFGACGAIIKDTIYYFGGAVTGTNFPAVSQLRKGVINPNNPSQITWSVVNLTIQPRYRAAMIAINGYLYIMGGSAISYNYNATAYNGSGIVPNFNKYQIINPLTNTFVKEDSIDLPKDLRGAVQIGHNFYLAGGILNDTTLSNQVIELKPIVPDIITQTSKTNIQIQPNPIHQGESFSLNVPFQKYKLTLFDFTGKVVKKLVIQQNSSLIATATWPSGIYYAHIQPLDRENQIGLYKFTFQIL